MHRRTLCSVVSGVAALVAVGGAIAADCYVAHTVSCCTLSVFEFQTRSCTYDANCRDIGTSSGNVTHNKNNPPGSLSGNTGTSAGSTCTCTIQKKKCNQNGFCINDGPEIEELVTPYAPGGGQACTTPAGGGGGGED
jgi:hypothetical protein